MVELSSLDPAVIHAQNILWITMSYLSRLTIVWDHSVRHNNYGKYYCRYDLNKFVAKADIETTRRIK